MHSAIVSGREFLKSNHQRWSQLSCVWIEKVTYSSPVLSQAYCLAAMNALFSPHIWTEAVQGLVDISPHVIAKFSQFFSHIPLFLQKTDQKLKTSLIENYLFLPQFKQVKLDIFPRKEMAEDKYLEYIPFTPGLVASTLDRRWTLQSSGI